MVTLSKHTKKIFFNGTEPIINGKSIVLDFGVNIFNRFFFISDKTLTFFKKLISYHSIISQKNSKVMFEILTITWCDFRWFLQVLGYHKLSKPSLVNGVAMAFFFFLVRIAVIPVYYSQMYSVYGTEAFYRLILGARVAWILCSLCLDVMNVMWMRKILRGCLKVLRSSRSQKPIMDMGKPKMN